MATETWDASAVEACALAFAQATTQHERAAAEARLLAFRASPSAIPVAMELLQAGRPPIAQFHALGALREGAGAQWAVFDARSRDALQLSLLSLLAVREPPSASFVVREAAQVAALLAKLALLDAAASGGGEGGGEGGGGGGAGIETLLSRVGELLASPDVSHLLVGLHLLESLVLEFGSPVGGAAGGGLNWAEHARARTAFGREYLLPAMHTALRVLQRLRDQLPAAVAAGGGASGMEGLRLGGRLPDGCAPLAENVASLVALMLSWDFDSAGGAAERPEEGESRPGLNATVVRPPSEAGAWGDVLGNAQLLACSVELYAAAAAGGAAYAQARHALRQLLVMLASVSRRLFRSPDAHAEQASAALAAASALAAAHPAVAQLGGDGGPLGRLAPCGLEAEEEEEEAGCALLDAATMLQRLVAAAGADSLLALPHGSAQLLLVSLHNGAVATAAASASASAALAYERTREAEAFDVCSEALASLRLQARYGGGGGGGRGVGGGDRTAAAAVDDAAWRVYAAAVTERRRAACAAAAEGAEEEVGDGGEAEADDAERLATLATLGRSRAAEACGLLGAALRETGSRWRAIATHVSERLGGGGGEALSAAETSKLASLFEELVLLLDLSRHLLTDAAEGGDTPEVPLDIAAASDAAGGGAAPHPAIGLVEAALGELQPQLQVLAAAGDPRVGPFAPLLSPLVGEGFLELGAALARVYLMPDESAAAVLCPPLLAAWGRDTAGGAALLQTLAEAAAVYALRWRGEERLALLGCGVLAAACRRKGAAPLLAAVASVAELAALPKAQLPPRANILLQEALARAALASAQPAAAYAAIAEPVTASLRAMVAAGGGGAPNGKQRSARVGLHPAAASEVAGLCACVRGLTRATTRHDAQTCFAAASAALEPLVCLLPLLESEPSASTPVLRALRDAAGAWMGLLSLDAAAHLARACAAAVATHARLLCALPMVGDQATGLLPDRDRSKQVRAMLDIVAHVASRDPADGGPGGGGGASVAAAHQLGEALSASLHALLPCVVPPLLCEAKLLRGYLHMLSALLESHGSRVLALPAPLPAAIGGHLIAALAHHELAVGGAALDTVFQLARSAALCAAQAELPAAAAELLAGLLQRVGLALLGGSLHPELVDPPGGNALLALIAAAPHRWHEVASSLVELQPTAEGKQAATLAFGALLTARGVSRSLAKPNRVKFRANLADLLRLTRSARFAMPRLE